MSKKLKKIALWLVFLTLYLNIGWGLGYYYHSNISTQKFETASWHAKLLGGHCIFFAEDEAKIKATKFEEGPLGLEILSSILWPVILAFSFFSWVVHIIFWVLKFVGWGGLFKLVFGIP